MLGSLRDGRRNAVYPTVFSRMKQRVPSPNKRGTIQFRGVRLIVPGGEPFLGLVKSQYHFGQQTAGAFGFSVSSVSNLVERTMDLEP